MPLADVASPPVDFPLYGVDEAWRGLRWLDFFDAKVGDATWGVRLGHQNSAGDAYVGVAVLPKDRYDGMMAVGSDRLSEVAFYGAHWLSNITLPDPQIIRPEGFLRSLVEFTTNESRRYQQWPTTSWLVDTRPVRARMWRFAGGWAGFTDGVPRVYLVAVGFGVRPDGLAFATIRDSEPYGFDQSASLRLSGLVRARDRVGPREPARINVGSWHADQLALVPTAHH